MFRKSRVYAPSLKDNSGFVRPTIIVPLIIVIIFVILTALNPSFVDEQIETLFVDFRFKFGNIIEPADQPADVVIITIDEKSLAQHGRWPWSRRIQAELIDKVFEGDPRVVAVDIFYPESESDEADRVLGETIERHGDKLVMALGFEGEEGKTYTDEMPDVLYDHAILNLKNLKYLKTIDAHRVLLPPDPIANVSNFGHVYALPDKDGKIRWENLYIKFGDEYFPSLSLRTALKATGKSLQDLKVTGGISVDAGELFIPTDLHGRFHIKYYGKEGTIAHESAADVLAGRVTEGYFRDKVVFIGTTAIATYDQKVTPFSANYPGVEKNATVAVNIMTGDYLTRSPAYADIFIVILIGLITIVVGQRKMNSLALFGAYNFIFLLFMALNQVAFTYYGIRLNLIYPLLTLFSEGTFIVNYRYFVEEKKAKDIKRMFSSYVTERVVNELIKNPEMAKLGGDRREVTVFFSDIRSFTTFSEQHEPEEVVAMLNEYLTAMTDIVFRWEGTLDKFIGDAVVAFWGAPLAQENHPELAIRCSLHMIDKLKELQDKWRSEGKTPLEIGIGLNTGEVIVGNIGAEGKKMDYTVIGDHVNLAARVESLTKKYAARILMTEYTVEKLRGMIESNRIGHVFVEGLERVIVKGKDKPVGLYKVTALGPDETSVITDPDKDKVVKLTEK